MKLYGYWRSSAAYRVRIALNIKQLSAEQVSVHLVNNGGEQHLAAFKQLNPQALVPALLIDAPRANTHTASVEPQENELALNQSLAIIEYLEEVFPSQNLLPSRAIDRAQVRAMALAIACDIHPVNNLRVLQYLGRELGVDEQSKNAWYRHWIEVGFEALETMIETHGGTYCFGDQITLADVCLVPQVYNAERFNVDLSPFPNIQRVTLACRQISAFKDAAPEAQADAT